MSLKIILALNTCKLFIIRLNIYQGSPIAQLEPLDQGLLQGMSKQLQLLELVPQI